MLPNKENKDGHARDALAKNDGIVAPSGLTPSPSIKALYKQTKAYGVQESTNPTTNKKLIFNCKNELDKK